MSDAEIGQMRNGLGLSGNQLERYQTQRSIVIKKQADLVNCSALGSLAIEKGFETTVDKLLKESLKKAAGTVGGALGGAAAISGGIVIGMLLSTEEVGESKEELEEFVKEQEEKGENYGGNKNKDNKDKNSNEYKPPKGGGGTTDTVRVEDTEVSFGHGGRHLEGTGLSVKQVNEAIANDVVTKHLKTGSFYKGRINIGNVTIEYTSYGIKVGRINVGTYYPILK